jgi:hypothetical protein
MNWKKPLAVLIAAVTIGTTHLSAAEMEKDEWYVRLILNSDTEELVDRYNLLGQFNDATPGFDARDLPELGQTWPGTYLSVIFYRPDWDTDKEAFNTDFRPVAPKTGDEWTFEVRSDDPARDLTLAWQGKHTQAKFERMVLVDLEENEVVPAVVDGEMQVYHFRMNGVVREFAWRLLTKKEYKQYLATGELPPSPTPAEQATPSLLGADPNTAQAGVSLHSAELTTGVSKDRPSSGWLPLGWGQGEGRGYRREDVPAGLPDDPFAD